MHHIATDPVSDRIRSVTADIAATCRKYGRDGSSVNLLAVTKTVGIDRIRQAIAAGQHHFGENYLQEGCEKIAAIEDPAVVWHYIGAIQSNKTAEIAQRFSWVHTVSREKIARRLSMQRPAHLPSLKVMVQVNISGEASKAGMDPGQVSGLIAAMLSLPRLEIRGLMAIPAPRTDFQGQRESYRRLRELKEQIVARYGDALPCFQDL